MKPIDRKVPPWCRSGGGADSLPTFGLEQSPFAGLAAGELEAGRGKMRSRISEAAGAQAGGAAEERIHQRVHRFRPLAREPAWRDGEIRHQPGGISMGSRRQAIDDLAQLIGRKAIEEEVGDDRIERVHRRPPFREPGVDEIELLLASAGLCFAGLMLGASPLPFRTATFCLLIVGFAVFLAWLVYGRRTLPFRYLIFVPVYVVWKIPLYVAFFFKKKQKTWERTERS